ncbi:MAG TPA: cupredoxin family copper-binding protein [Steroidobacteraceae bacterium]|jgi:plastocyanin
MNNSTPIRFFSLVAVILLLATRLAHAGGAEVVKISAKNFMFSPATITVKAGATVTWTNLDEEPHTVYSDAGLFRSGALDTKDSFSFTFEKPGTYHYLCTIHPKMLGTVVVE